MTVDVVCAGTIFLDVTFEGLEELPAAGTERYARDVRTTPGGAATIAIGVARLGLRAAVTAPLGRDFAGELVRRELAAAGVACAGPEVERTAVTVALPVGDDRAFATFVPPATAFPYHADGLAPRAFVVELDAVDAAPAATAAYVTVGDRDAHRHAGRLPAALADARALVANRDEALLLTGETSAEGAALALAETVSTAVVTLGGDGAVAAEGDDLAAVAAPRVDVRDTTGAGDLFTAAYVWGDLHGLPLGERLRRAVVYATLSVRTATGAASAATLEELERAIAELDPETLQEQTAKESR